MEQSDKVMEWEKGLETKREAEALRRLVDSEGWSKLLGLLERLLTRKEKVKANQIRAIKFDEVSYTQGYIDALNFVMSEPERIISSANSSSTEETEN